MITYNIHHAHHRYNSDYKDFTHLDYTQIGTTVFYIQDMPVFGTIEQLTREGYENIPIDENQLTYNDLPVVFVMARKVKRYNYIDIYIFTKNEE